MLDLSKDWFEVEDKNGNITKHNVLFSFDSDDGNTYLLHTANEEDENGNALVYASVFNKALHGNKLVNIECDDAFETIQKLFIELMDRVKIRREDKNDEKDIY